jgi:hypothetical protein
MVFLGTLTRLRLLGGQEDRFFHATLAHESHRKLVLYKCPFKETYGNLLPVHIYKLQSSFHLKIKVLFMTQASAGIFIYFSRVYLEYT